MANQRICSVPDCGKPVKESRKWCEGHYSRWYHHGDPLAGRAARGELMRYIETVACRFEGDECLNWPYGKVTDGYGSIKIDGRSRGVHRIVCELVHGPAPSGRYLAAHSCGNRSCCNPRHLRWATIAENSHDRWRHGTMNRGENVVFAKLTEKQVREIMAVRSATVRKLAARFGVSKDLIYLMFKGGAWRHLTDPSNTVSVQLLGDV